MLIRTPFVQADRCQPGVRRPRRWGVAAVELAVTAPVLFAFVFGIIEFSRLGMCSRLLATAAAQRHAAWR